MTMLSKRELKKQIKRFIQDKDRGISIPMFCELAGISKTQLHDVFDYETEPLSEYVQTRVNKAYAHWKSGRVRVMKRPNNSRYVDFRREERPPIYPQTRLKLTAEGIKLHVGLVNRHDYSEPDLNEQMRG
jgi:hypothetical protein